MKNFIRTSEKIEVKDYPYGFKLRTTLYDYMEFNPKKGYRHVTQTINPKNGKLNAPKKSTYYEFMLRYLNEDGHIKCISINFNRSFEDMNNVAKDVVNVWHLLDEVEKQYCIDTFRAFAKISAIASIQYAGTDQTVIVNELKKLTNYLNEFANIKTKKVKGVEKKVIVSYNVDNNILENLPQIDLDAIKQSTPENYNPFKR